MQLSELEAIASEVCGDTITLQPHQSGRDVPGWDSLNNTLIALEISARFDIDFTGQDLAACPDFAAVLAAVDAKVSARS